jgi:hypothetical protein
MISINATQENPLATAQTHLLRIIGLPSAGYQIILFLSIVFNPIFSKEA